MAHEVVCTIGHNMLQILIVHSTSYAITLLVLSTAERLVLHLMHRRVGRPPPKPLPKEIEGDCTQTPQRRQRHIQHDWFDKPTLLHPRRDELAEAIAPEVLVHSDGHED